ncbi:MAG: sensor domain-containing diguanylate cyclase [Actinobacteria bacterium]|nr:sensor domain-containing diguanylate cyclase [Actinomycetota bacterium]
MSSTSSDLTLLGARLRVMTIARIVLVGALLAALAPVYRYALDGTSLLVAASLGYLVLNGLALLVLRRSSGPAGWLLDLSLVADAAWAGAVLYVTGGTTSGFIFLLYLQLVAATVLFSWRSGVKLAILHTIAILAVFYGQAVGFATEAAQNQVTFGFFNIRLDPALGDSGRIASQVVRVQAILAVVTVWIITGATAFFSNVNERALRRSNQELALLRELSVQLEATLDLGEICEAIANGVVEELKHDRAVVWMAQGGSELVPAGAAGFDDDQLDRLSELRLVVGPGPLHRAVETRRPVLVAREHARPAALADTFEIDSPLIIVPLQTEGRILGLLTVEVAAALGRAPRVKGRDLRILSTLSTEASLALDNARLHAELRDLSITDALTGVYNHRHFQQRLQEELDRSARLSTLRMPRPVSLILMDVDHFKKINDRFGHPAGDDLLRALTRLVQRVLRSSDVVCRYGGEEFAIILPETPSDAATQVGERLRAAIELSSFAASDARYLGQVTASFGIASFERGVPNRGELIREADEALYAAKAGGRNLALHAADAHRSQGTTSDRLGPEVPDSFERVEPSGTRPSG